MRSMKMKSLLSTLVVAALTLPILTLAAPHPAFYFNGFENAADVDAGTFPNDAMATVARVASGTNGITSAAGSWHAEAGLTNFGSPDGFVFTRYGGYNSVFPAGGYTTSIDIYLDMAEATGGNDLRFDWSSAINMPNGNHRRDFIFSGGTDPLNAGQFLVSASNNAPGWPGNPARFPLTISSSGWYTFQHRFYDAGAGVLAVDMSVLNDVGTELAFWTLSDPTDIIGSTVGGNRYGWLVTNDFSVLALDNVTRSGVTPTTDGCRKGGWQSLTRADGSTFKNQGDCIQYVNTGK